MGDSRISAGSAKKVATSGMTVRTTGMGELQRKESREI